MNCFKYRNNRRRNGHFQRIKLREIRCFDMMHVAVGRISHQVSAQIISIFNNTSVIVVLMVAIIVRTMVQSMHLFARYSLKYIVSVLLAGIATIVIDIHSTTNICNKYCQTDANYL